MEPNIASTGHGLGGCYALFSQVCPSEAHRPNNASTNANMHTITHAHLPGCQQGSCLSSVSLGGRQAQHSRLPVATSSEALGWEEA